APDRNHFYQTHHIHETCIDLATVVDNDNMYQPTNLNNEEHNTIENIVPIVTERANGVIHAPFESSNKRKTCEDDNLSDLNSSVIQNCTSTSPILTIIDSSTRQTYQMCSWLIA
ncbi:unnamed protein product, partial [Didymodactylos carnosus]